MPLARTEGGTHFTIIIAFVFVLAGFVFPCAASSQPRLTIGAKHFNESYILGEIVAQSLESEGFTVTRQFNLGGTLICFDALRTGAIDGYVEYSGTLGEEILRAPGASLDSLRAKLALEHDLVVGAPLGFNNTYAFAVRRDLAELLGLTKMSDLAAHPELRVAVSYEFLKRLDGWQKVAGTYALAQTPAGVEHGLAYEALADGKIDVTDVYSTDGEIPRYELRLLRDDRAVFPSYLAIPLFRNTLDSAARRAIRRLAGTITDSQMQAMNAQVVFEGKTFAEVARTFLHDRGIVGQQRGDAPGWIEDVARKTLVHLMLTGIALLAAILIAVPAGVGIYRVGSLSRPVLYVAGLMQTIPSIALLALMIPFFGIGIVPAVVALSVYGLLPILRNTTTALLAVDPLLKDVATAIGLTPMQRLRFIEFPLSLPTIFAGIRTAAVINVGTATLAAFIGAGGLGEFIVTGLALNNTRMILEGAIPAAGLAVIVELIFEALERRFVPTRRSAAPALPVHAASRRA